MKRPTLLILACAAIAAVLFVPIGRATDGAGSAHAQSASGVDQTVGLFVNEAGAYEGYTLFSQINYPETYLIDNDGRLVHSWPTLRSGYPAYLLEDGTLVRFSVLGFNATFTAGGVTGVVEMYDWDGNLTWEYEYFTNEYAGHHDVEVLPNGNVLLIAWEYRSGEESIAAGRSPDLLRDDSLWPLELIEVQPTGPTTGDIVWEWHAWDHLVQDIDPSKANYGAIADHPELVNVNYFDATRPPEGEADWLHTNGIDYNADLDQIVVSVRHFDEFWIIDHSTTTEEAAGHSGGARGKGGDLLYRWGNPQAYGAGTADDQQLFLQHNAEWVPAGYPGEGNITLFNNGLGRPGEEYSEAEEIVTPLLEDGSYAAPAAGQPYGPEAPVWEYRAPNPTDFYSSIISGAQRLPNGNTLICAGVQGDLFEVTPEGEIVWRYVNPVTANGPVEQGTVIPYQGPAQLNAVFRSYRYAPDYPGLAGRDLTPGEPLELPAGSGTATPVPNTPTPSPTPSPTATATPVPGPVGDANCDGLVNAIDAALVSQYVASLVAALPCSGLADANGDGIVNSVDTALILQLTAGLLGTLPP